MNRTQAARIHGLLAARYPDIALDVAPNGDGARISMVYPDGYRLTVTTGDQPGTLLLAMLGMDPRALDGRATEGTA